MVTPSGVQSNIESSNSQPAPLAWKEFRRRRGIIHNGPRIYTYATPITFNVPLSSSPRYATDSSQYVVLVTQALQELGSSTGGNISAWIAKTYEVPHDKINNRRLHYMVNAILSSAKYRHLFHKEQMLRDEKRTMWSLRKIEEDDDNNISNNIHTPNTHTNTHYHSPLPHFSPLSPSSPYNPDKNSNASTTTDQTSPSPSSPSTPPFSLSSRRRKRKDSDELSDAKKVKVSTIIE